MYKRNQNIDTKGYKFLNPKGIETTVNEKLARVLVKKGWKRLDDQKIPGAKTDRKGEMRAKQGYNVDQTWL